MPFTRATKLEVKLRCRLPLVATLRTKTEYVVETKDGRT